MPQPRPSRKRTTLRFLATMLVALGTIAFAASIAMAAQPDNVGQGNACNQANPDGGVIDDEDCNNGSGNDSDCDDDNKGQGIPATCLTQVCRNGVVVTIKLKDRVASDTSTCPIVVGSDPVISVCRNGAVVSIKTSEKLPSDGPVPCEEIKNSDPDVTVCRAGAAITIPTSQKLATDTTPPCTTPIPPGDSGAAPGSADAGGPIDQGDGPVDGVEYEHDSLAPTNAAQDGPGAGPEIVVAGAADAPAADATTVPGSGVSGAVAPANGQLPYTGLSTLQVALLGTMLLGMGALCWLVGSSRPGELVAA